MLKPEKRRLGILWGSNIILAFLDGNFTSNRKLDSIFTLEIAMLANTLFYSVLISRVKVSEASTRADLDDGNLVVEEPRYYLYLLSPVLALGVAASVLEVAKSDFSFSASILFPSFIAHSLLLGVAAIKEHKENKKTNVSSYFSTVRPSSWWSLGFYVVNVLALYLCVFAAWEDSRFTHLVESFFAIAVLGCLSNIHSVPDSSDQTKSLFGSFSSEQKEPSISKIKISPARVYYIPFVISTIWSTASVATQFGLGETNLRGLSGLSGFCATVFLLYMLPWGRYLAPILNQPVSGDAEQRERLAEVSVELVELKREVTSSPSPALS